MNYLKAVIFVSALSAATMGCGGDTSDGNAGAGGGAGSGGTAGTGGGDQGTEINSDATLGEMMDAIAVDLSNVLGGIAPDSDLAAEKQDGSGSYECPQSGTARYEQSPMLGGGGTIYLESCTMAFVTLNGALAGFLELDPESIGEHRQVSVVMGRSVTPIEVSGLYRASLTVDYLEYAADYPNPDPFFIWYDIQARTPFLVPMRARSCDPLCEELTGL